MFIDNEELPNEGLGPGAQSVPTRVRRVIGDSQSALRGKLRDEFTPLTFSIPTPLVL